MKRSEKTTLSLVKGHMENLSRDILSSPEYRKLISEYVSKQCGIYALYQDDRLTYVGLAANLPRRLTDYLTDRHSATWNRFSVYITHNDEHMRELESMLLRVLQPKDNRVRGRLKGSENLVPRMLRDLKNFHAQRQQELLGSKTHMRKTTAIEVTPKVPEGKSSLAGLLPFFTHIRTNFNGEEYKAIVLKNGSLKIGDETFDSPTGAAVRIFGQRKNGWKTWKFKNANGEWVLLDELRKKPKRRTAGQRRG